MSAPVKIIRALLVASGAITALVSTRIFPGELPQETAMPALGISHISTVEKTTIDASAAWKLVQTRIEVVALAKDYVTVETLMPLIKAACNYQHGTLSGYVVVSIMRELEGPDMRDSDLTVFSRTIDFLVTWQEPNP